jgi:hypothetical protein
MYTAQSRQIMAEFLSDIWIVQEVSNLFINTLPQDGILLGQKAKVFYRNEL